MLIATSPSTMALKQQVEDDKIVSLTSAYAPGVIEPKTRYLFRQYSTASDFLPSYVDWMTKNFAERRMATLNPNDETGWGHKQVTDKNYKERGFDIVSAELYERAMKDFAPLRTKTLALKPDVIDLGGSAPPTAGLIVRQARELGYKGKFVQTGGPGWAAVVDAAGKEAAEGMINVLYANPSNEAYQRLAAAYKKAVGQEPNEMIVCYYDGLTVMLKAIQKAGIIDDTTRVATAFKDALPMTALQGDEMTWEHQQIRTFDYVGILKEGKPAVVGKIK